MICCKIIANYQNTENSFSTLLALLSKHGKTLWAEDALFFGSTENFGKPEVISMIKKSGIEEFFIEEYTKEHESHETEVVNGWITERLIENNYNQYIKENKIKLLQIDKTLQDIESRLDKALRKKTKNEKVNKEVK